MFEKEKTVLTGHRHSAWKMSMCAPTSVQVRTLINGSICIQGLPSDYEDVSMSVCSFPPANYTPFTSRSKK